MAIFVELKNVEIQQFKFDKLMLYTLTNFFIKSSCYLLL